MKINEAVDEFLSTLASEGRSPNTVAAYRRDLSVFIEFAGSQAIGDITPEILTHFMAHRSVQVRPCGKKRAPSTINRYRVALKALFAWCEARWLIKRNPTAILKCKRYRGLPPAVLSEEDIAKVISYQFKGCHGIRDKAMITFMLLTGCRLGETVALNVGDVDITNRTVTLHYAKGGDPDRIILCNTAAEALRFLLTERRIDEPLFITSSGKRISTRQVQRIVARRVGEAGIGKPVTAHTLRHTFATRLYNRTGDIRLVQKALRHEHVTTTENYAQVDPRRWRQAVEFSSPTP